MRLTVDCVDCRVFSLTYESTADPKTVGWANRRRGPVCPACVSVELSRRVVGVSRAPTRTHPVPGVTYGYPGSTPGIPVNPAPETGTPGIHIQSSYLSSEVPERRDVAGGMGGVGGKATTKTANPSVQTSVHRSPIVRPIPPPELKDFDTALSEWPGYHPTTAFFERLTERYVTHPTPGLDLTYEAQGMVSWLKTHPGKRHDIPRFAERWLVRAREDAERDARRSGAYRQNGSRPQRAGDQYRMGSGQVTSDDQAAIERMRRVARGEDDAEHR